MEYPFKAAAILLPHPSQFEPKENTFKIPAACSRLYSPLLDRHLKVICVGKANASVRLISSALVLQVNGLLQDFGSLHPFGSEAKR